MHNNLKIEYRPEIDGLRALAVLSVIIYHAKINFLNIFILPGGFFGVDIFFVISGYLISKLIFKEFKINQKFNFFHFYERRARRLLPVLLIVLIFTGLVSSILLYKPSEITEFSISALLSIFFASNFFFYTVVSDYWNSILLYKPLLHTWSLSVEEQYYILFPIFFIISLRFLKNKIIFLLFFFIFISLCLAEWGSYRVSTGVWFNDKFSFYLLPTRIWELLFGTLVLLFEKKYFIKNYHSLISFIGFILMILPIIFLNDKIRQPGFLTLIPVIGTSFIILGCNYENFIKRILSFKKLVFVGLISYSLYLWHFPIFSFARRLYGEFEKANAENLPFKDNFIWSYDFLLIILIFIISIPSYYIIEKPFRNKKKIDLKKLVIFIFISTLIIFFICFKILYVKFDYRNYEDFSLTNAKYFTDSEAFHKSIKLFINDHKGNFTDSDKRKILIMGDCHAEDIFVALKMNENKLKNIELGSLFITNLDCLEKNSLKDKKCNEKLYQSDVIIIDYKYNENYIKSLVNIIPKLKELNKKIILINHKNSFLKMEDHSLFKFINFYERFPNSTELKSIEKEVYVKFKSNKKTANFNKQLKKIAYLNNIDFLNVSDLMCSHQNKYGGPKKMKKKCHLISSEGKLLLYNYGNFTKAGAEIYGKQLIKNRQFIKLFEQ